MTPTPGNTAVPGAPDHLMLMVHAAFGDPAHPGTPGIEGIKALSGAEPKLTFRVDLSSRAPVVLRVGPEASGETRSNPRHTPIALAGVDSPTTLAEFMPKILFIDFSQTVIERSFRFEEFLPGGTASELLDGFAQAEPFFEQFGGILGRLHAVQGPGYGPLQGPLFASWSQALRARFAAMMTDLNHAGLAFNDIRTVSMLLERNAETVDAAADAAGGPRLLHGNLWLRNVLLEPDCPHPRITGLVGLDCGSWGSPLEDFSLQQLRRRNPDERAAFWRGYGTVAGEGDGTGAQEFFLLARRVGEARLEYHRLGQDNKVEATYPRLEHALDVFLSQR